MNKNTLFMINKPKNITSHDVIKTIKKKFNINKIGYCGTLDPIASGILIINTGNKTKISNKLSNTEKRYIVNGIIGIKSTTYDIKGKIKFFDKNYIPIKKININYTLKIIKKLNKQIPPITSSIKHNNIRMYKYAKLNIKIKPKTRYIDTYKITLIKKIKNLIILDIICSKGTYVRSIVDYIGKKNHIPICINNIIRLSSGKYKLLNAYNLNDINKLNVYNFEQILKK